MNDLINEIQSKIGSKILIDYDMGKSTWFRVGGKARGFITINNIYDLLTFHMVKKSLQKSQLYIELKGLLTRIQQLYV